MKMPRGQRQAGDRFVDFVLAELGTARGRLPRISRAADLAADRIISKDGGLLAAGDDGVGGESVWRSGSIAFFKRYLPETKVPPTGSGAGPEEPYYRTDDYEEHFKAREAKPEDVVLLGFESEREEQAHLPEFVAKLRKAKSLVLFFGSRATARGLEKEFGKNQNFVPLAHDVPDGGIIQVPGWPEKVCSGRSLINRLYLWLFEAELIAAFMRRGKIPGILLSVTYESPQIINLPLIHSYRFIPAFEVHPVKKGVFGRALLDYLRGITNRVVREQRESFRRSAAWLAGASQNGRKPLVFLIAWPNPVGLPGDPGIFGVAVEHSGDYPGLDKVRAEDVVAYIGYNWYPSDLAEVVDKVGAKLIACLTLVQDQPPKPAVYRTPLLHVKSLDELPKRNNHIYIDLKFAQYDACLKIPGYPFPAIPTSWLSDSLVYWHLVADTVELIAQK
jgi:hypothetical protein